MFYFTGDVHGNVEEFMDRFRNRSLTINDTIVILGDAGLNYYGNYKDHEKKMKLYYAIPATIFCVHGNHEMRPENIAGFKCKNYCGGLVWYQEHMPHIVYAIDGMRYKFGKRTALVMGGAYSIDKYYRLSCGANWFADEQIAEEKRLEILDSIRENPSVDLVLTHTCPYEWQPTDLFISGIDQSTVDNSMEHFFTECERLLDYKHWLFGHFHDNRKINDKATMLFDDVLSLRDIFHK